MRLRVPPTVPVSADGLPMSMKKTQSESVFGSKDKQKEKNNAVTSPTGMATSRHDELSQMTKRRKWLVSASSENQSDTTSN